MKRIKNANQMFLVVILFYLAGSFLLRRVELPVNLSLVMGEILMAVPVFVCCLAMKTNPLREVPMRPLRISVILLLIVFAFSMLPVVAVVNLISMLFSKNYVVDVVDRISGNPLALNLLLMAVVPCIVEELAFRGVFYHSYRRRGLWIGAIVSGGLFGLMHMNFNQFSYAFLMGIVFAILVEATGSIFAPMVVHFMINANSVVLSWLTQRFGAAAAAPANGADVWKVLLESAGPGGLAVLAVVAGTLLMMALGGAGICFALLLAMSKLSKREAALAAFKPGRRRERAEADGERMEGQAKERVVDIYLITAVFICIAYMVWLNIKIG